MIFSTNTKRTKTVVFFVLFVVKTTAVQCNPVVLVHGFKDSSSKMQPMARALRKQGWTVLTPTLKPSWGQAGIDELARQLSTFIDANFHKGERVDLVGFSMGGLVCRYYVQRMGGLARVQRLVTISSPHNGTLTACWWPGAGCRQMQPHSEFLRDLNGDIASLDRIQFTSLWTPLDLMIVPAKSSHVPVGCEIKMWVVLHPLMVWQPNCIRTVAECLQN